MNGRQRDIQADARADFLARLEWGLNPVIALNSAHQESAPEVGNHTPMRYSVGTNEKRPPAGASTPELGRPSPSSDATREEMRSW